MVDKRIAAARRWAKELDSEYFGGFFSDKNLKIKLFTFKENGIDPSFAAYAEDYSMTIGMLNESFDDLTIQELKENILHEMLHLFIRFAHPDGHRAWDDDHPVFIKWAVDYDCVTAVRAQPLPMRPFKLCKECAQVIPHDYDGKCPMCGGTRTKFISSKRLNIKK